VNLCIYFEGTGQGVAGRITNVTRLRDACVEDARQKLHLEAGPGTRFGAYLSGKIAGVDWRGAFKDARRWFEASYESLPTDGIGTNVFLFGFSRGALLARHFAAWLDKLGVTVTYLGIWDTVDATVGLDVSEACPPNVIAARHAVARDETRRFFQYVPLRSSHRRQVVEMLFPGSHSDVGGLYDDNHLMADLALAWIAAGAKRSGVRLRRGVRLVQRIDTQAAVLHDSHGLVSNLWGAFKRVRRNVAGLRLHPAVDATRAGSIPGERALPRDGRVRRTRKMFKSKKENVNDEANELLFSRCGVRGGDGG